MPTPIGRDLIASIERVHKAEEAGHRRLITGPQWLRAARASWLYGDLERASYCYRAAVTPLLDAAERLGQPAHAYSYYASLALGATWMAAGEARTAEDRRLLNETYRVVEIMAQQLLRAAWHPLEQVSLETLRVRAAWLTLREAVAREGLARLPQPLAALDQVGRTVWNRQRDSDSLTVYTALLTGRQETWLPAVMELDRVLALAQARPPTVIDLVDEELLSFAAALVRRGLPEPQLRSVRQAGALRTAIE